MTDSEKMREVPPITDETYKALMVALGMPNNRSLLSALQQIANHATQRAAWQAAKSVPVVGEPVAWRWAYAQKSEDALANSVYGMPKWEGVTTFNGIPSQEAISRAILKGIVPIYLYCRPATSITEAELVRIRDYIAGGIESEGVLEAEHSVEARALVGVIDAAIAAEGEKE